MSEEKQPLTTVAYSKSNAVKLSKISKELGLSKTQFIDACITQFHSTGEDPTQPIKQNLSKKLSSIENRLIGFIKTQEKEYLSQIVDKVSKIDSIDRSLLDLKAKAYKTKHKEVAEKIIIRIEESSKDQKENGTKFTFSDIYEIIREG